MALLIDPIHPHPYVITRDGSPVMIFAYMAKQARVYLGIFYNKSEWIACSWNGDGSYISKDAKCGMDLVLSKPPMRVENVA